MKANRTISLIFSTALRLIMMTVVCFITSSLIFSVFGSQPVRTIIQSACIIVTMGIIYPPIHHLGGVERNLADAGQIKPNMLKGLYIGIASDSPFLLTGIFLILSKLGIFTERFYGIYKLVNSIFYPLNYSILPSDETILTVAWSSVVFSLLMLLIFPVVTTFAYLLGYHRFFFREVVFYKKKPQS